MVLLHFGLYLCHVAFASCRLSRVHLRVAVHFLLLLETYCISTYLPKDSLRRDDTRLEVLLASAYLVANIVRPHYNRWNEVEVGYKHSYYCHIDYQLYSALVRSSFEPHDRDTRDYATD